MCIKLHENNTVYNAWPYWPLMVITGNCTLPLREIICVTFFFVCLLQTIKNIMLGVTANIGLQNKGK